MTLPIRVRMEVTLPNGTRHSFVEEHPVETLPSERWAGASQMLGNALAELAFRTVAVAHPPIQERGSERVCRHDVSSRDAYHAEKCRDFDRLLGGES